MVKLGLCVNKSLIFDVIVVRSLMCFGIAGEGCRVQSRNGNGEASPPMSSDGVGLSSHIQ